MSSSPAGRFTDRFRHRGKERSRTRLHDSSRQQHRRTLAGLALLAVGLVVVIGGVVANNVPPAPATRVAADGVTAVPRTWFFQNEWVLFGSVTDPRRVPAPAAIGCRAENGISIPEQPEDLTRYGSRVVEGQPVSAMVLFSRSGGDAAIRCDDASAREPLWLMQSSPAPPFTPTAIVIAGILLLVVSALVHPSTANIQLRRRPRETRSARGPPASDPPARGPPAWGRPAWGRPRASHLRSTSCPPVGGGGLRSREGPSG